MAAAQLGIPVTPQQESLREQAEREAQRLRAAEAGGGGGPMIVLGSFAQVIKGFGVGFVLDNRVWVVGLVSFGLIPISPRGTEWVELWSFDLNAPPPICPSPMPIPLHPPNPPITTQPGGTGGGAGGGEDPLTARHKIIQKQATTLSERNDAEGLMRLIAQEAFAAPDGSGRGYGALLPPALAQALASGAPAPAHAPPVGFDVGNACICLSR